MKKTETLRIYYNPRCSKCRAAAALAAEHGYATELIEYLQTPPSREELIALLRKLDMKPLELIRTGEEVFKQLYAGRELSDEQWLDAMLQHPVLIERPIVVRGDKAVVARPPEKMLTLIAQ
ncbi:MAG TPA: arsenate reductase (glutaredoxin) [Gallionellaceae bacterium]